MVGLELVSLIKILADENRLRILNLLRFGELNVGDIEKILNIRQSNLSRHLNRLHKSKLINYQKRAQWVYYHLDLNALSEHSLIKFILAHELDKIEKFRNDIQKMKEYMQNCYGDTVN